MVYYFDHQDEVERDIRMEWEEAQQAKAQALPSPFFVRMRARGLL
jgi:hypothetical protein